MWALVITKCCALLPLSVIASAMGPNKFICRFKCRYPVGVRRFLPVLGFPTARVFPVFTGLPSTLVLHIYVST